MPTDRQKLFILACKDYSRLSVTSIPLSNGALEVFCKDQLWSQPFYDGDLCAALIMGVLAETFENDSTCKYSVETVRFTDAFACWILHVHIQ